MKPGDPAADLLRLLRPLRSRPGPPAAAFLLCLLAALAVPASARTYYVSRSGPATRPGGAPGGPGAPFRSFRDATAVLRAGDVLIIGPGVYREPLQISGSGAPGAPILIEGQGRPLIETEADAVSVSGSYVVVSGLEAHASGWGSAFAVGKHNHHVTLVDDVARESGCGGVSAQYTDYLTVRRVTAYGNGRRAPWQCSGISLYHPEASDGRPGVHNLIEDNLSYDNENVFVDEAVSHSHGHTTDGNGIIVDDADHTQADVGSPPYLGATLIQNNLVCGNGGRGIHVFHSSHVLMAHNLAFRDLKDPNLEGPGAELSALFARDVTAAANVVVTRPGALPEIDGYGGTGDVFTHNLLVADRPPLAVRSAARFEADRRTAVDPALPGTCPAPPRARRDSGAEGLARGLDPVLLRPFAPEASSAPDAGLIRPQAVGARPPPGRGPGE